LGSYLSLTGNTAWGTSASWLLLSGLMLPLAILGLYLLRGMQPRPLVLDAA